jgi:hypothetical protein
MLGLKSITNRALKAVRDIGSFASDNPLGTSLLGLPFLFGQDGLSVGNLFGKDGFLNQNKGLVSLVTSLIGGRALQGDKDMQMKIYNDMIARLEATDRKYGSEFGGSPFKKEQFGDLIADIKTGETFDKFDEQGKPIKTEADESGRAVPVISKSGGIASLMAGGPPEQDMGQFGSSSSPMGASTKNPFDNMNIISGMIPETPLRQVMPPTMNMGGQATGVPGLTPDMTGPEMMDTIEDNPGITAFFPRQLGMIDGPGGPKDDKIPAMLSDGEFVFTAKAVQNAGGPRAMYNMMNKLDPESSKGRGII